MSKILFIGIDSMDSILLKSFEKHLPNFSRLNEQGRRSDLESTFPPDSDTAWATISTGLNPAEHGVFEFMDPLEKSMKIQHVEKDNSTIRYKTFWDKAGAAGKKVCVITPHYGYPTWKVNGIMVGTSSVEDKMDTYPAALINEHPELMKLIPMKGFPGRKDRLAHFLNSYRNLVENETEIGLSFYKDYECDLFFIYSSALDAIQHYFWNYYDEKDPSYQNDPAYKDVILNFYKQYDAMVGKFLSVIEKDTIVIVASDHGHGMRPYKVYNINEYLRQNQLLSTKSKVHNPSIHAIEATKKVLLDVVSKYKLESYASKMLKIFPIGRKLYTTPLSIDWERTMAYTSDLSGIKSYSYGGIIISKKVEPDKYEEIRTKIISELSTVKDPDTGQKIFKWICRRDDLYKGEYLNKYPDIVFDMIYGYGAGCYTEHPLFDTSKTHNFVPGSHRKETPIFYMYNYRGDANIGSFTDIHAFILNNLNAGS